MRNPSPSRSTNTETMNKNIVTAKSSHGFIVLSLVILLCIIALAMLSVYLYRINKVVQDKFAGKRWEIPAKVYAKPLDIYIGAALTNVRIKQELALLGYKQQDSYERPGSYLEQQGTLFIHTRGFDFGDSKDPEQILKIQFALNKVSDVQTSVSSPNSIVHLEPTLIGGIYPAQNEDRVLVKLADIPQPLIDALISTEDKNFYHHYGVSIRGTVRAILNNMKGGAKQGGSTLTQQLVKNFYLSPERKLKRKANEAVMALLLEAKHSKGEILEAYANEINLGQNGTRSINGFGLASQFYFGVPLKELKLSQVALLVGLVKGPSAYNPWRHPEDALKRRNVVLDNMVNNGKITAERAAQAKQSPLGVVAKPSIGNNLYPDFLDIVQRQLKISYREEDLTSDGLQIFTSLDPQLQTTIDADFNASINQLIKKDPKRLANLQGAAIIANPQNGEILAVVGGTGMFTGFNRAIDAKRQVGSLLKPAVYLTALQNESYHLATNISDDPITITTNEFSASSNREWTPKNYDNNSHGLVPLYSALAHSYNQATVRLGWELSLPAVFNTIHQLGITQTLPKYPSVLLGAVNLSPMDMLGMYQTFAAQGYQHSPHAIRSVVNSKGQVLERDGDIAKQSILPEHAYLINYALQQVVKNGTASAINTALPNALNLAGKTGTTNDQRDAWFAGYSGNYVTVVWLGHDNNAQTGLTGASGALPVWINIMKHINPTPVNMSLPSAVSWNWIDKATGQLSSENCEGSIYIPMVLRTIPVESTSCAQAEQTLQPQLGDAPAMPTPDEPQPTVPQIEHATTPDSPSNNSEGWITVPMSDPSKLQ